MASVTGGHFLYGLRLVFAEFAENFLLKISCKTVAGLKKCIYLCSVKNDDIVQWCNGSTSDSGSACEGSSPSWTTKSRGTTMFPFLLTTNLNKLLNGYKN